MDDKTIDEEPSLYEMLANFLTDEALNDVTLKGCDGVEVRANRFLLAARSQVFRGMLVGKFQEASSPAVELSFPGTVLKAVVEYILTDSAEMLTASKKRKSEGAPSFDFQQIQSLVSLAEAASYFHLPGLGNCVRRAFKHTVKEHPSLSFAMLQACRIAGASVPEDLVEQAVAFVRETPTESISANAVACLSTVVMEDILKDADTEMTEYQLFLVLSGWADATGSSDDNQEDRKKTAKRLSKYICLKKIHPEDLSTTVTSSGLFMPEDLSEAYKCQALMAKQALSQLELFIAPRNGTKPRWTTVITKNSDSEPPCKIMVEGAGSNEVNGVYFRDGCFDGIPKYDMAGTYEGEACVFSIIGGREYWWLTILDLNRPASSDDIDFYKVEYGESRMAPPVEGWVPSDKGIGVCPKLLYSFHTSGK